MRHHHSQFALPLTTFEAAFMLHLIVDWLHQNEWMAANTVRLSHPAAWVHWGHSRRIVGLGSGVGGGITLGLLHMVVDPRLPVQRWI
jgi:hypothetical protein